MSQEKAFDPKILHKTVLDMAYAGSTVYIGSMSFSALTSNLATAHVGLSIQINRSRHYYFYKNRVTA